ncbi:hypothetical protein HY792_07445 [Candidatus Desantisbacteria bacterium]|nr:hypothetical protein [Candidatus Desantisbacteria bacterium]
MRFDKLTLKAQEAIAQAQEMALDEGHQEVTPEHLLSALLKQKEGIVVPLLGKLGINLHQLSNQIELELKKLPKVSGSGAGQIYLSHKLNQVFNEATKTAGNLKDEYISTEHLLMAIVCENKQYGINKDDLLKALVSLRGSHRVFDQNPENTSQLIFLKQVA